MGLIVKTVRGDFDRLLFPRERVSGVGIDLVELIKWCIVILVAAAILYWVAYKTGAWEKVPAPFKYVIYGIIALVALDLLVRFAGLL